MFLDYSRVALFLDNRARKQLMSLPGVKVDPSAKWTSVRRTHLFPDSSLTIGRGSIIAAGITTERKGAEVVIGSNTFIGNSTVSCATRVEIGDDVLISWGCNIVDHDSHSLFWEERSQDVKSWYSGSPKSWDHVAAGPVKINSKSWIGLNAIILKGVEIGEGAVVGAGSVVTKSVEPWTIVAGNPAKVIRVLQPSTEIEDKKPIECSIE